MRATRISICLIASLALSAPSRGTSIHLTGETMGTAYGVQVPYPPDGVTPDGLRADIERLFATIDRQMSTYRPDSEISRFNSSPSTAWTEVSADTSAVVTAALRVSRLSKGAFDPTVGALVDLWGFGSEGQLRRRPSADALRAALVSVGYAQLAVREQPPAIRKRRADLRVDLSAIGNGFGVDRVAAHLERLGIESYLVEIGGELRGRGNNARDKAWTVAVEQPGDRANTALAVVRLDGAAIATSGGYRNYFDEAGLRYIHVIDPRTGAPLRHDLALVSVIDDSAMRADALATALLVLGPDDGVQLAHQGRIAALFAIRDGAGLRQLRTPEFARRQID